MAAVKRKRPGIGKPVRLLHTKRCPAARVFRVLPDPKRPHLVVEVRIARDARRMREAAVRQGIAGPWQHLDAAAFVHAWFSHSETGRRRWRTRPRGVVAHVFLNLRDLRARPAEVVAHEATHAALAFVRVAPVAHPDRDEEPLAYAVGRLADAFNHCGYLAGAWPR